MHLGFIHSSDKSSEKKLISLCTNNIYSIDSKNIISLDPITLLNLKNTVQKNITITINKTMQGKINPLNPNKETINFFILTNPINGIAKINKHTGIWSYTPNLNFIGLDYFTIKAINKNNIILFNTKININIQNNIPNSNNTNDSSTHNKHIEEYKRISNKITKDFYCFKKFDLESNFSLLPFQPNIYEINNITGEIDIYNYYLIDTPLGISLEGQNLTGKSLMLHSSLSLNVDYTSDVYNAPMCSSNFNTLFSTFLVVPKDYIISAKTKPSSIIENIYFLQTSNRSLFINTSITIKLQI